MLAHCERILTRGERVARARKEIDDTSHEHTEATKRTTENVGCLEAVAGESRGSEGGNIVTCTALVRSRAVGTAPYVGDSSARFARDGGSLDGIYPTGRMLLTPVPSLDPEVRGSALSDLANSRTFTVTFHSPVSLSSRIERVARNHPVSGRSRRRR